MLDFNDPYIKNIEIIKHVTGQRFSINSTCLSDILDGWTDGWIVDEWMHGRTARQTGRCS